jgi:hypothetical protein
MEWGSVARLLRLLSLPTGWPRPRAATIWFAVISAVGMVSLLVPRTTGWTGEFLHSEDGQVFLSEYLEAGLGTLFQTYAGYLHLVPRAVTIGCDAIAGPDGFAGCITVGSSLVRVAAMAVAFPVLAAYSRSWRWGLGAAAAAFLFLPAGQQEVLGNITNLRWFLLTGAFFAVFGIFRTRWLVAYAAAIALLAALSDPLPLLLAPFAIWRIIELRGWMRLPSFAVLAGGLVHLLMLDPSARGERGGFGDLLEVPSQTIGQLLVRGPLVTQWGMTWTQDLMRAIGVPLAISTLVLTGVLAVLAWRGRRIDDPAVPFVVLLVALGLGFLLVTLSFPASYIALADIWNPSQPARYSVLTGLFLMPALVIGMSRAWQSRRDPILGRAWTVVMAAVLVFAYIGDAGGDARNTNGLTWTQTLEAARAECAATGNDPAVPNSPVYEGWTTRLTCEWLGVG